MIIYKIRYNMGVNKRLLGDYQDSVFNFSKAIEIYEQSKKLDVNIAAAYNASGLSNFENEDYAQAAIDFKTAISKNALSKDGKSTGEMDNNQNQGVTAEKCAQQIKPLQINPKIIKLDYLKYILNLSEYHSPLVIVFFISAIGASKVDPGTHHLSGINMSLYSALPTRQ